MCNGQTCKSSEQDGVFRRILVAVDGTDPSLRALKLASKLAHQFESEMALVHVIPGPVSVTPEFAMAQPDFAETHRAAGEELLKESAASMGLTTIPQTFLREGAASQEIIAAAHEWKADLIVLGTHGRGPVAHALLGSTAEHVVRYAHIPVLTVGEKVCERHGEAVAKAKQGETGKSRKLQTSAT